MSSVANILVQGAIISSFYALIAIGFTLIFSVGGIFNFAHGGFITLGGFSAYLVTTEHGFPIEFGILAALVATAVVGGAVYQGLIQYIENKPMTVLILTLVVGFFIQHGLRIFVTGTTITVRMGNSLIPFALDGTTTVAGLDLHHTLLVIFTSSWAIILVLFLFVEYTGWGRAIVAISMSERGATLVGIDRHRINLLTWVLAAAMAGFAGVLLTVFQTGDWNMGLNPLIISFAIVVLGGLGSIKGSVIAAYIIGYVETVTVTAVDPRLTGVSALLILILVMLVMPEGLFGRESET